jgi:hypothetical protein
LARDRAPRTLAPVLGEIAKRLVNAAVVFLAAITFFLVPLGDRTPAQHVCAIFDTPAAQRAADACAEAGRRIAESVTPEARSAHAPPAPKAAPRPEPKPAPPADSPPDAPTELMPAD